MAIDHDNLTEWYVALIAACPISIAHHSEWQDWCVLFDDWGTTVEWDSGLLTAVATWRPKHGPVTPVAKFEGPAAHLQALAYVAGCRAVARDEAWPNMTTAAVQWLLDALHNGEYEPRQLYIQDGLCGYQAWDTNENEVFRCRSLAIGVVEDRPGGPPPRPSMVAPFG